MIARSWLSQCWQLQIILLALVKTASGSGCEPANAQIIPDHTLGAESSVVTPITPNSPVNRIDGGAIRGANLFHSFEQFSIPTGGTAYFNNAATIQNVISRVTGSSISNIDGRLQTNGTANLFLLNPKGIIFGPNASLDIKGSFLGSTASSLNFADGTQFSASVQTTPLLTISVPVGLQFAGTAGSIINKSRFQLKDVVGLQVLPDKTLALVGGNVNLDGGYLTAPSGRIELGAASGVGTVGLSVGSNLHLNYPDELARADISFTNRARADASGEVSGDIQVQGRRVRLTDGSQIRSNSLKSSLDLALIPGGTLSVTASELVELIGVVKLSSNSVVISGLNTEVDPGATGNGADITVDTQQLILRDGARISTATRGQGNGGNLTVRATESVELIKATQPTNIIRSGLFATVAVESATGRGGNMTVETQRLSIREGGIVAVSTFGNGPAGTLEVKASDSIELSGIAPNISRDPFSSMEARSNGPSGSAGDLIVKTGQLIIRDQGRVNVSSRTGQAGNINIESNSILLDNQGKVEATARSKQGGSITITTDSLSLNNDAVIRASSEGQGNAGKLTINVDGTLQATNSSISTTAERASGGDIAITAKDIRLNGDSNITTSVFSSTGNGGNINLTANSIIAFDDSDILAAARDGKGGNITLDTPAFFSTSYRPAADNSSTSLDGNNQVDINASGQLSDGTINLPDVSFIQNSLTELPENLIDTNTLVANSCLTRNEQQGSFIITGAGSLPNRPEDAVISPYPTGTVRSVSGISSRSIPATHKTRSWQIGDPIVEPQGMYQLGDGQIVLSRECS